MTPEIKCMLLGFQITAVLHFIYRKIGEEDRVPLDDNDNKCALIHSFLYLPFVLVVVSAVTEISEEKIFRNRSELKLAVWRLSSLSGSRRKIIEERGKHNKRHHLFFSGDILKVRNRNAYYT